MDDFFTPDIKKQKQDDFFTPDTNENGSVLKSEKPENDTPPAFGGRNLLATGVRVGSGMLSGEGGLPGALISGAGEAAAGLIEGPRKEDVTPSAPRPGESPTHAAFRGFLEGTVAPIKRIGVEAGFGAIPFGKVVKGGEIAKSAVRSGAIGAAHTAISRGVEGKPITKGDLTLSAGLGALLGGGFAAHGAPKPTNFEIEPTLHTGEGASAAEFNKSGKVVNRVPSTKPLSTSSSNKPIGVQDPSAVARHVDRIPYGAADVPAPSVESPRLPGDKYLSPEDQTRQIMRDQKNLRDVEKWAEKQDLEREAQDKINEALRSGELQGKTTVREGYKSGPFSVSTTYKQGKAAPPKGNIPVPGEENNFADLITPKEEIPYPAPDNRQPQINNAIDRLSEILGVKKPIDIGENVTPIREDLPLGEVNVESDPLTQSPLGRDIAPPPSAESIAAAKAAAELERAPLNTIKDDIAAKSARSGFHVVEPVGQKPPVSEEQRTTPRAFGEQGGFNPTKSERRGVSRAKTPKTVGAFEKMLNQNIEKGGLPPEASAPSVEAPPAPSTDKFASYPEHFKRAPGAPNDYPPEVMDELDRLGAAYASGDKSAGKQLAEIRDFFTPGKMRESWKGTPEVPKVSAPEEGSIADQVASRAAEPDVRAETEKILNEGGHTWNGEDVVRQNPFEPNPQGKEMSPDEVQGELNWIQKLLKSNESGGGSEKGAIDPKLLFGLAKTLGGAAIGAPTGAALYPEHPIRGALGGGIVGGALAGGGMRSLIENRDAGLLLGPAMIKKHLSDMGTIGLTAGEKLGQALGGDTESAQQGAALLRELFRVPTNMANYGKALKNPALARDVLGQSPHLAEATMPQSPFLRQVIRGYTAPQYATTEIFRRAGIPEKEAFEALNMADPKTDVGKWWAKMQGNKYVKLLRPFARYATNLAEGGLQRVPGVALIPKLDKMVGGDPNTKIGRTIIGSLTTGAGALQGMKDQQDEELGTKTAHPFIQATLARYLPNFVMGEALSHAPALRELRKIYVPAVGTSIPDVQATGENADTYPTMAKKFIDLLMEQTLPDFLSPAEKAGQAR